MRFLLIGLISASTLLSNVASAQTKQTKEFYDNHPESKAYFFYKSVIRMIDFTNSDEYFEMVKGIDKAVLVNFDSLEVTDSELNEYLNSLRKDSFEEAMTYRRSGGIATVYIKDEDGEMKGIIVIMKADEQVYILDIVGKVELSKLMDLTKKFENFKDIF